MSSIDQRIVEMQFNNSAFEKGVKETLKTLESLKKELNLEESAKGIEKLQKAGDSFSLARMADSISNVEKRFSTLGIAGMTAIANITNSAVNAGKHLVKSLSVDQVTRGWGKYEEKTTSVQTLMNSTGKTIDEVNGYLERLMWFSDETSYSFTDMTSSLGQLTTSGGDIEKLIPMIEGIATATAYAGKDTAAFSRAIYNLNQSYSSGYLKYMDWKSLELAGVASSQLKEVLIDTAVSEGMLKRNSDGIARTVKGTEVTVASFAQTLAENWADTTVMEKGFGKFSEMMEEAYKLVNIEHRFDTASEAIEYLSGSFEEYQERAAKSAQEAKTFKEAIEATKDAVSSGWMESFELIFGDYEEAKVLWTDLANGLWDVFAAGSEVRNEILGGWKDAGGRTKLIEGLTYSFSGLYNVLTAFKAGIGDYIFGDMDEDQRIQAVSDALTNASNKLWKFGSELKRTFYIGQVFTGFKEEVDENTSSLEAFDKELKKGDTGDEVKKLQQALIDHDYNLGPAGADGIFGPKTLDALRQFQEEYGLTIDGIYKDTDYEKLFGGKKSSKWIQNWNEYYSKNLEKIKSLGSGVAAAFSIVIKVFGFLGRTVSFVFGLLSPVFDLILDVGVAISNLFSWLDNTLSISEKFDSWFESIQTFLSPIGEEINGVVDSVKKFFGIGKYAKDSTGEVSKFGEVWEKVKTSVKNLGIWNKLKASFSKLKVSFTSIGASIKSLWDTAKQYAGEKFVEIFEKTGSALPGVIEKIASLFSKFIDLTTKVFDTVKEFLFGKTIEHGALAGNKTKLGLFDRVANFFSQFSDEALQDESKLNFAQQVWLRIKNTYNSVKSLISTLLFGKETSDGAPEGNNEELGIFQRVNNFFSQFKDDSLDNEEKLNFAQKVWIRIKETFNSVIESISTFLFGKTIEHGALAGNKTELGLFDRVSNFFSQFSDESMEDEEKLNGTQQTWLRIKNAYDSIKSFISTFLFGKTIEHGALAGNKTKLGLFDRVSNFFSQFSSEALKNEDTLKPAQQAWIRIKNTYKTISDFISTLLFGKTIEHGALAGNKTKLGLFDRVSNFFSQFFDKSGAIEEKLSFVQIIWNRIKIVYDSIKNFISGIFKKKPAKKDAAKDTDLQNSATSIGESIGNFFNKALEIYNKYKPLIFGGGVLAGLLVIAFSIASFINKFIENLAYARGKNKNEGKTLGEKMLDIAYAIGIIAGIIVLLGSIKDTSVLSKGSSLVGGIMGAIVAMMLISGLIDRFLSGKGGKNSGAADSVKNVANAIVEIAFICWALGKVDGDTFMKGYAIMLSIAAAIVALEAISAILGLISGGKSGDLGKGIKNIASAILEIAFVCWALGKVDSNDLMNGYAAMLSISAVIVVLELISAVLGRLSGGKSGDLGKGIKSIASAILEIAFVCWALGKLDGNGFAKGYAMMLSISVVLAALMIISGIMSRISKGKFAGASSFIGIVVLILAIGYEVSKLGQLPTGQLVKGGLAVVAIAFAVSIIARAFSKIKANSFKKSLGSIIMLAEVAGLMYVLSIALSKIKDVNAGKIAAFTGGLSAVLLSIGGLLALSKGAGIGGALSAAVGLAAIAGTLVGLVMGFGALMDIPGFSKLVNGGMSALGEAIGSFIGSLEAAKLGALSDGLDKLANGDIDQSKVNNAVESAKLIAGLSNDLAGVTFSDAITVIFGKGTAFSRFCETIPDFATGMQTASDSLSEFGEADETGIANAVSAAEGIAKLAESVSKASTFSDALRVMFGGDDAFTSFVSAIPNFATGMKEAIPLLKDFEDPNSGNGIQNAVSAAKGIADLAEGVSKASTFSDAIRVMFGGDDPFTTFVDDIPNFATGMQEAATSLSNFGEVDGTKIGYAVTAAQGIADFITALNGLDIGAAKWFGEKWFGKETNMEAFTKALLGDGKQTGLIDAISQMATDLSGKEIPDISSYIEPLWKTADALSKLEEVSKADPDLTNITSLLSTFQSLTTGEGEGGITNDSFFQNISADAVGQKIVDFATNLSTYIETAKGIIDGYTTQFNTAGSGMMTAMTGGAGGEADTSGIESTCSAMLNAASSYQDNFENVGKFFIIGMGNGISAKTPWLEAKAAEAARRAYEAAMAAIDAHSPSRKTYEMGKFFDQGFANGMRDYGKVAEKSSGNMAKSVMNSARGSLSDLSSIINNNMEDSDPVVRPVVDLTNVSEGAKAINGIIGNRTATIGAELSTKNATAVSSSIAKMKNNQNGNTTYGTNDNSITGNPVNVSGNNFYIRSENDIRQLASELATLTWEQRRALGATR